MDINQAIAHLDWHREPYGLYEPIEYTLASGGKRLRPTLALLASQLFGGKEDEVLPAALALEVFHNFTLLHDDVMDKADVRRGRPTVHVRWNDNVAILSGDQMMIEAYKLIAQVREDKQPTILRLFNKMATEICEGQQYDMEFETQEDVTLEQYIEMIRLKTSVLLATALQIGAYMAGANAEEQEYLYQYGICVGLAFQIQDDLLDVYGDPATFGKAIGGDICCKKKTFMLLSALQIADEATRKQLELLLEDDTMPRQKKIDAVTYLYDQLGVRNIAEKKIEEYTMQAMESLRTLPSNETRNQLQTIAQQLISRKS